MKLFQYSINDLELNSLHLTITVNDDELNNKPNEPINETNQGTVKTLQELSAETRDQVKLI
jgi:hypothetical protein